MQKPHKYECWNERVMALARRPLILLTSGGRGGNAPGSPGGRGAPFWYGNPGAKSAPGGLWNPGGKAPGGGGGGAPGVGGFPLAGPGCPFGVGGLLPGVPGFSPSLWPPPPPSPFGLRDGVDRDEDDMFEGGLSPVGRLSPDADPGGPAEEGPFSTDPRCSPLPLLRPERLAEFSSSLPTSTTRSPSLFSPPSDS